MQAVVKTRRTSIRIDGEIPERLLAALKKEYGDRVQLIEDRDEEVVDIFETTWYRKTRNRTTPGDNLKTYRQNAGLTQASLGQKLGGIPRQHISNMERGIRPISLRTAKQLARVLDVSIEKFI